MRSQRIRAKLNRRTDMDSYKWVARWADSGVTLQGPTGRQLWAACKSRKFAKCEVTGEALPAGSTVYRPIGNPANRWARISTAGIMELETYGPKA